MKQWQKKDNSVQQTSRLKKLLALEQGLGGSWTAAEKQADELIEQKERETDQRVEKIKKEGLTYLKTETQLLQRIGPDHDEDILRIAGEQDASMVILALAGRARNPPWTAGG